MNKNIIILFLLLFQSIILIAGGGKEAFRNYFMGSHYFAEGQFNRAENHLRRAYQLHPQQYNFALAYALVLGQQAKTDAAMGILGKSKNLLSPQHPDYSHLVSLQYFVNGMINLYGQR
ncbi:MAG: tetratricopeptide repeat protein, partial [Bacteroidota bacterium]